MMEALEEEIVSKGMDTKQDSLVSTSTNAKRTV